MSEPKKKVTYVIVVHGMGMPRPNETMLPVISRLAEIRGNQPNGSLDNVLTLGAVSSRIGVRGDADAKLPGYRPWISFPGIPGKPTVGHVPRFDPNQEGSHEDIRFAEVWWKDILSEDAGNVLQPPATWASSIIGRLDFDEKDSPPLRWIKEVMASIRDLVALIHRVLWWKAKAVDETIFTDYLGDVQMYGDYARTRGRAVRRFHDIIGEIEKTNSAADIDAHYIVIAHSLGSIMALDALVSAHPLVERGPAQATELPGYLGDGVVPDTSWVHRVDALVTLGSPIDKFLSLWPWNYRMMDEAPIRGPEPKIRHYNYCEEQDPVGSTLPVLADKAAYRNLFSKKLDIEYARCAIPGWAHLAYWTDTYLFADIVERVFDGEDRTLVARNWYSIDTRRNILLISYAAIPLVVVVAIATAWWIALTPPHDLRSGGTVAAAAAAMVLFAWAGRRLIDLSVWWRQLSKSGVESPGEGDLAAALNQKKNGYVRGFWIWYGVWLVLFATAAFEGAMVCGALADFPPRPQPGGNGWGYAEIAATMGLTLFGLAKAIPLEKDQWIENQKLLRPLSIFVITVVCLASAYLWGDRIVAPGQWTMDHRMAVQQATVAACVALVVFLYQAERTLFIKHYLKGPQTA